MSQDLWYHPKTSDEARRSLRFGRGRKPPGDGSFEPRIRPPNNSWQCAYDFGDWGNEAMDQEGCIGRANYTSVCEFWTKKDA